jgi:hypothetical protein
VTEETIIMIASETSTTEALRDTRFVAKILHLAITLLSGVLTLEQWSQVAWYLFYVMWKSYLHFDLNLLCILNKNMFLNSIL